ncbi:rhomboid family intramembrane serine protease [Christiangramia sp. SM2212]|uniref:Rhomboid family intramembrane serine protease n=1 Tax=Christiangramia sediminicola TaxID=3073267 RepID=A0ABU1EUT3_9FLAO|nr:rhomboid family intramembrane serine protease [Christiangramia sp. SM2212]MDR5591744.1 rhomboid family intramembrane serine protease [Christiangramia sp. SM2212]
MKASTPFVFTSGTIGYPLLFLLLIWIVFWIEIRFGVSLNSYGVRPGEMIGLRGIVFSPFIHSDIKHLFNNTIPLFILSLALFYFYRPISWKVLLIGLVSTGILTWLIGRPANHIGASGIIYLLASFLFFKGVFSKHYRLVALSLIVVFVYGGLVWYVTPIDPDISWEGHLSGLLSGFGLSLIFRRSIPEPPKYQWERPGYSDENDLFMQHFDENGNFVDNLPIELEEPEEGDYNYIYKEKED